MVLNNLCEHIYVNINQIIWICNSYLCFYKVLLIHWKNARYSKKCHLSLEKSWKISSSQHRKNTWRESYIARRPRHYNTITGESCCRHMQCGQQFVAFSRYEMQRASAVISRISAVPLLNQLIYKHGESTPQTSRRVPPCYCWAALCILMSLSRCDYGLHWCRSVCECLSLYSFHIWLSRMIFFYRFFNGFNLYLCTELKYLALVCVMLTVFIVDSIIN